MTDLNKEYAAYVNAAGDGSTMSFEEFVASKQPAAVTEKVDLTEEDVAYIKYTDAKGDGTPLSFQDWKAAGKPAN